MILRCEPIQEQDDDDFERFEVEEEDNHDIGWIAFIASYVGGYWEIHEFAGCGLSLIEWRESQDISEIAGYGGYKLSATSELWDALSDDPTVEGMMVMCKAHVVYSRTEGFDGVEYDMDWEHDLIAVTYPNGAQQRNAIRVCEEFALAGGLCKECGINLIGATIHARKTGLCDRCAKRDLDREVNVANDPLYDLRCEVAALRSQAYPSGRRKPKPFDDEIKNASREQLDELRKKFMLEIERDRDIDYMYR